MTELAPDLGLDGKVAIITGGGSSIGLATAKLLARFGVWPVLAGRNSEDLQRGAGSVLEATGRKALTVPTDLRDDSACLALVERTLDDCGRIDVLVNAGDTSVVPLVDGPIERFDSNVSLHLRGPYILSQMVALPMIEGGGGAIVNVSSSAAVSGVKGGIAYGAAKAALQMLTRLLSAELEPHGIRCNAIAVGAIQSDGALRSWPRFRAAEPVGRPLRRTGQPEDIARGVLYFSSDLSSWVSGLTLEVNAGPTIGDLGG